MPSNGGNRPRKSRDGPERPSRDHRGRWLRGHCPNPKGRPRKERFTDFDPADIRTFGNGLIEVRANGRTEVMSRRAALSHKMFEDAMKGKVSMQRFLFSQFEGSDKQLAEVRLRYQQLMTKWVIENDHFEGLDGKNIPFEIQMEILCLQALLHHYFPSEYPDPGWKAGNDEAD